MAPNLRQDEYSMNSSLVVTETSMNWELQEFSHSDVEIARKIERVERTFCVARRVECDSFAFVRSTNRFALFDQVERRL